MWWTDYSRKVKCHLRDDYGFIPMAGSAVLDPTFDSVPDGEYPMTIVEGKLDRVRIINGHIHCCNFDEEKA